MPTFPNPDSLQPLVGQEIGVSDWFLIAQADIDTFAAVTRDRQWIHCDTERARAESPFGTTIAHGFLTLALLSHLHTESVQIQGGYQRIINYGLNRVRFPAPVTAGSRVRLHSKLQTFDGLPDAIQLIWLMTLDIESHPKPALVAEWLLRYYR